MPDNNADTSSVKTSEIEATLILSLNQKPNQENSTLTEETVSIPADHLSFDKRFVFICDFAKGGIGCISKAKDISFDRIVAVKTLNQEMRGNARAIESFVKECRLNAKLDHPSIVPIYSMGRDGEGHLCSAMKFINGTSLKTFIENIRQAYDGKKISQIQEDHALMTRLEYFLKICEVVEYCHSMKIIHGDLKPDNILMGAFGELYVMDWGCAQTEGTKLETLSGTPNYLPPEFFREKRVTRRIDVYALGMILFELVTLRKGKNEYSINKSENTIEDSRFLVTDPQNYLHFLPALSIAPRLRAIILKAVSVDPGKTYPTAAALAADIRHYIYDEEISAMPDNTLQHFFRVVHRNRIKTLLVSLGLVFLLAGGWFTSSYAAMKKEQRHNMDILQRIRLQSYTNTLTTMVQNKLLMAQAQLLLFADNLMDDLHTAKEGISKFYDNNDYSDPKTEPPGMKRNAYYPQPVTFEQMVRIVPQHPGNGKRQILPDAQKYVSVCKKVANYDLSSRNANGINHQILFRHDNQIHRMQAVWANGVRYSYPGTYEDPDTRQYANRFSDRKQEHSSKRILWSRPYQGLTGQHRIRCQYPMFDEKQNYLGEARLELRLEKILAPAILANRLDPVHELFFVGGNGTVVKISDGKLFIQPVDREHPEQCPSKCVLELLEKLKENQMQLFVTDFKGKRYFVSGGRVQAAGGYLIQMIEEDAMKNHNHVDLSLDTEEH